MRWIDGLAKAQRVVLVVALGVAFIAVGSYIDSLGQPGFAFGWTGYAPLALRASGIGLPTWLRLVVWLVVTGAWAIVSIRLLGPPSAHDESD